MQRLNRRDAEGFVHYFVRLAWLSIHTHLSSYIRQGRRRGIDTSHARFRQLSMEEGGYEDDLELLEEYDLEHDTDDSRSDAGRRSDGDDGDSAEGEHDPEALEEAITELKARVVEVVSALGGVEEKEREDGSIESVYVIGDDCLRE